MSLPRTDWGVPPEFGSATPTRSPIPLSASHRTRRRHRRPTNLPAWTRSPPCAGSPSCWSGPRRPPTGSRRSAPPPSRSPPSVRRTSTSAPVQARSRTSPGSARRPPRSSRRRWPAGRRTTWPTWIGHRPAGPGRRGDPGGTARRPAFAQRLERRRQPDRGDGRHRCRDRARVPGPHRSLPAAHRRQRADRRATGAATRHRRDAEQAPRRLPAAVRHRVRHQRGRHPGPDR